MRVIELFRVACMMAPVLLAPLGLSADAGAQSLPRVEGALTMEEAVDLARQKSLRVKASDADARMADSMRQEALAPFWPQFSANGYVNDQRMAPNVYTSAGNTMARNYQVFNADRNRDANLTAMYPLFSGGRDYYGYKAAAARADAARQMLRGTEVDVAMQARLDYIAALRETENVRVTGELLRDVEERLRISRKMFDEGRVPRYYLLRDEAELANVVQMDVMARSRADLSVVSLKTTMGVDLASAITLADRLELTPTRLSIGEGIRQASEGHPDLKAAAKQREAAQADVRAAYGNYFPQVSVGYMYDWAWMKNRAWESQAEGFRRSRADSAEGYSVGVVVTLPLFDGFSRENALKTAKAKLEKALQSEGLVRQQILKEVNQAALMLAAAEKSVEASRKGLEQADEEFRIVKERFASGRGIQLEILDAQVSLTRARFNAVAALADYSSALAMWLRATGRVR
jgi:outer membrane protein TolC